MAGRRSSTLTTLERLAPGTPLRQGLERILQHGRGALIVLGSGSDVDDVTSGGFRLERTAFTPARLSELAKMDGGIVLDGGGDWILAAAVHFVPSADIHTDETGSRHRTAQRLAVQTGRPVVSVSEGRRVATLYLDGEKYELSSPGELTARVNQELQTLDRLRRQLDEAETVLTHLEVSDLATFRSVVALLQRSELVRRVGLAIERQAVSLGDEGRLATIQLADMVKGVEYLREVTLRDYWATRRGRDLAESVEALEQLPDTDLSDPLLVGKCVGFGDLDQPATPRGLRILGRTSRIPESVREELLRRFKGLANLLGASLDDLESVAGVGAVRAGQLRHYFDRLLAAAEDWAPRSL